MRVSSVVALVCWLSVLAAVWLALLGVVAWGPALWGALLFWVLLAPGLEASDDGLPEIWGEDFTFCKRWRDIGGKVYLDALLRFQHIGRKAWSGCYAESLNVASLIAAE